MFWESIRESGNASDFEAYLRQYPAGAYRVLATTRRAALRPAAGADPAAVETFRDCPSCPEMVVIPAGTFRMGCLAGSDACSDSERPVHEQPAGPGPSARLARRAPVRLVDGLRRLAAKARDGAVAGASVEDRILRVDRTEAESKRVRAGSRRIDAREVDEAYSRSHGGRRSP